MQPDSPGGKPMASSPLQRGSQAPLAPVPGELATDYRSRVALEQLHAAELRQRELAEQSSDLNAPDVRIRAWEKVHGLRLPADPGHAVLTVVAAATHLTLEQVRAEQRQRLSVRR